MAVESLSSMEFPVEDLMENVVSPLNGTDARRRLEDKLEEMRLRKELREFEFEH